MPKFLATGYYCETWKLLVEADTAEEAQDIADANIFEDGIEVDGYLDDMTLEEVADDFSLYNAANVPIVPVEEVEVCAPSPCDGCGDYGRKHRE